VASMPHPTKHFGNDGLFSLHRHVINYRSYTLILIKISVILTLLSGCAARILTTPCTPDNQQLLAHCPPSHAIDDMAIQTHQNLRQWLPFDQQEEDYINLAMVTDIPIQDAFVKVVGTKYQDAVNSLATKIWLIEHAQHTLDLAYYIYTPDISGYAILAALCDAVQRGVDVRLMVDSVGSFDTTHAELKTLYNCAAKAGFRINANNELTTTRATIQVVIFNSLTTIASRFNRRAHDKLIIADGTFSKKAILMLGGRNISNSYYGLDENLQPDYSTFKDLEVLIRPIPDTTGMDSPTHLMEDYFSTLFIHQGNKNLTSWWSYDDQLERAYASLAQLHDSTLFSKAYKEIANTINKDFHKSKVKLAHEIGNLRSNDNVVEEYESNLDANPNSIMAILRNISEDMPQMKEIRIVSPYFFLEEYLLKEGGVIAKNRSLLVEWLNQNPDRTLEIITNSVLTSDNFFTQAIIDMHTGPKLMLSPEMEKTWLDSDLDINEHNSDLMASQEWLSQIEHPRLQLYQTGKIDSFRLGGTTYYGKLHAKFIVTDQFGFVGTSNFDFRSMLFNNEVGFFILGDEILHKLNQEFDILKSQSYLWGSKDWLALREAVRQAGGIKGFMTKSQRSIYKVLKKLGMKFQF